MQRPNAEAEKVLNGYGIFTDGAKTSQELYAGKRTVGVLVEIDYQGGAESIPDYSVLTISKRGVKMLFSDWESHTRGESSILSFTVSCETPPFVEALPGTTLCASSFVDLCWNAGAEAPATETPQLLIPLRPHALYADLGWHMPSRFLDPFIDAMGTINDVLFNGALQDSVVYGPLNETGVSNEQENT